MKPTIQKNKWFLAFVIAAVIAVAAIVVAIVIGVTSNNAPDENPYVEGNEIGVYYYDVVDGEVLLTLSGGNNFTIAGPAINKTGTYTVDGANITLDFFKDEDGTAAATINGDTVSLVYDNATMLFLKKVNYSVSFDVNDDNQITVVKVVNGKTVAKPADPTKENSVFLGWYADEAFTTPFDFDATTVKADITVYAKWAEKTAGVADYTVKFDLGYEGAEKLADIVTVSGIAYGVTTPEREGYTFGGWWISMYEDGTKLSYAYTEDTVITADTTLYAVWYDNSSTKLNVPSVSVTESTITWTSVKNAASYKLTVIDPDGNAVVDNETVGGTIRAFNFADAKPGEYKISVVAVASNEANNSEAAERYYANKALDMVSDFTVDNGILIYGAVENAQKYIITIDCGNDDHVHTAFDNGSSTTYYIGNCPMQDGGILITVTASANGYASSTSKVFAYNKTLGAIENLVYDNANDKFTWSPVTGAAAYCVTVTVGEDEYTFNTTSVSFSVAGFTGDITVSVAPVTEGYNSPAAATSSCNKTAPAAPNGITVAGNVISWNAVDDATSYEVKIGTQTVTVSTNELNLIAESVSLTQGQVYQVKVKAISENGESSAYSDETTVGYFAMDPAVTYSNNTVYWSPVLGVSKYQVSVNGGTAITVSDATSAKVKLTKEGENLIEVRYVYGDTVSDWVSVTVNAVAVEYDTRSVAYGSFLVEYLAVGDVMTLPETGFAYAGYDFVGWYNAPKGAAGNGKLYADGSVFAGNAYTVVYAAWTPKTFNITLDTGNFDITNIEDESQMPATYTKDFTLPVPVANNTGIYYFAGWYTGPSGTGVQLTDELGNSVAPYPFTTDYKAYPYYSTNALTFTLQPDGTYAVTKGEAIADVTNLTIPVTYNEIPVTTILEHAFDKCTKLVRVSIPDTITLVGTGAFTGCTRLEYIDVYVAKPEEAGQYETFYSSDNGVLIHEDLGITTYLEVVPRAMTGSYEIPSYVEKIAPKAFYYSNISSIKIPANITSIGEYTFYYCKNLKTIEFAYGRENAIDIDPKAFHECYNVESVKLPANINLDVATIKTMLQGFDALKFVEAEEGGENYATVNGFLTNGEKDTILYCPAGVAGDITIPSGIKTIAANAFEKLKNITSVTIPVWVTSIEEYAFYQCTGINTVTFEDSRTENLTIGKDAFAYINALQTVTFEGNGTDTLDTGKVTIAEYAFTTGSTTAKNLRTVTIGDGVNIDTIGDHAFYMQERLREINISTKASVAKIGTYAFANCTSLMSFTVPATVTTIDQYAFSGCTNLVSINFETEGATEITFADYAFKGCTKLGSITLPDHLKEFKSLSFDGCDALKSILVNKTNTMYLNDENGILYKKEGTSSTLTELLFYPKGLAKENNGVVNNLPDTLTKIGSSSFASNSFLKSITIPASITVIDASAFANCENLESVHFDDGGTALTVGDKAFSKCSSLTGITLPSYTTTIGANAFEASGLTTFTVPAKVATISKAAFYMCDKLKEVKFNSEVDITIGSDGSSATNGVFSKCYALESIEFPASVTTIGKYTFNECTSLQSVTFAANSKLTTIDNNAFYKCTSLTTITIPKSVTKLGNSVFAMATATPGSLEEVIFELGGTANLEIGTAVFTYQPNLKSVTFPARTSKLGAAVPPTSTYTASSPISAMFTNDTALAEINIAVEEGITPKFASIDGVLYTADKTILIFCPFANVGHYENGEPTYEIVIPKTVTLVLTKAFMDNSALKTVTFEEFDKTDSKYGTQLLTIGNYASGTAVTYATIGGNTSSITTINLPSHLKKIGPVAFASKSETPITLTINPDASKITLAKYAFAFCRATSITIPGTVTFAATDTYIFSECAFMETLSVTFPSGITKIPDYTFKNSAALTSYEIPAQITEIGKSAFDGCSALTSMTIGDNIKTIGDSAFANCSSMTTVTFGSNITSIGTKVFQLSGLTSVTIPTTITDSVLSKATYMFDQCASLTTVTFALDEDGKSGITKIPDYMFDKCSALTTINLGDLNPTDIGKSAFYYCSSLTDIDFTELTALTTVLGNAFSYTKLVTVDLSETQITDVTTAFNNISTLKSMVFPKTVTNLDKSAFTNDKALQTITLSENQTPDIFANTAFKGVSAKIIIPEGNENFYVDEFGVVYDPDCHIIYHAGGKGNNLAGYTIPDTVTNIEQYAFAYATIDSLVIPEGVMEIGLYAFYYADIPFISVPSSVTTIGDYAFQYSGLKQIEFANEHNSKLEFIGKFAFSGSDLESIVLPDNLGLTDQSYSLFSNCTSLKSVTFGAAVKYIPDNTLGGCTALEEIYFQEGLEEISYLFNSIIGLNNYDDADRALSNNVKTVTIPSTVKSLGVSPNSKYDDVDMGSTFACFKNLETVIFAEGSQLEYIMHDAFINCVSLKSINIPDTVIQIDEDAFYGCESLESLDLSKTGVTVIREYTFCDTPSLNNLVLPEGTVTIEKYAFYNSGITEINITKEITEIGVSAFENASSLKSVTFDPDNMLSILGSETEATNIFKGTTSLETVTISNFLTAIGNNVFENSGVKEVVLTDPETPSSLQRIGEYAFANCTNLTDFNILENAKIIGDCAFFNCTNLKNVNVSEGLEALGAMAFAFCENLPEAPIPATVMDLGGNAYAGLPADKIKFNSNNQFIIAETDENGAITIYDSSKSILYAVYGASGDYQIDDGITLVMPGALSGNDITSVTVPKRFGTVADFLFMNCDQLSSVTIEDGITEIGQYAFYGTGLTTVVIPSTVTKINDYAFAYCASINNVTIPATVKTMGNYLFAYCETLSDFTFEESTATQTVGTHFFYNCPNITEVILPTKVNITDADGAASGSYTSYKTTIPSYMFAGTGIVHAEIPASINNFQTAGVFENCKSLETVTYKDVTQTSSADYSKTWYVGCDKLESAYVDSITHHMGYVFEMCYTAGVPSIHVGSIDESPDLYSTARFNYAGDLTIYFDGNTWQEVVDYMAIVSKTWECTIYDKDGNQLHCSKTNGSIAYVTDESGNVIWTAEA